MAMSKLCHAPRVQTYPEAGRSLSVWRSGEVTCSNQRIPSVSLVSGLWLGVRPNVATSERRSQFVKVCNSPEQFLCREDLCAVDKGLTYGSWLTDRCNVAGSIRTFLRLGCSGWVARCRRGQNSAMGNARLGSGETGPCATASGRNISSGWQKARRDRESKLGCSNSPPSTAGWLTT